MDEVFESPVMATGMYSLANCSSGKASLRRPSNFDRFIPFRPSLDVAGAHHQLMQGRGFIRDQLRRGSCTSPTTRTGRFLSVNLDNSNPGDAAPALWRSVDERGLVASTRGLSLGEAEEPSEPSLEYRRRLSAALDAGDVNMDGPGRRILPFSCHHQASPPALSPALSGLKSRRISDSWLTSPASEAAGSQVSPSVSTPPPSPRRVRIEPDTVLQLPLRNDFYCSLLDWGAGNTIGAGVDDGVYIWHAATADCQFIRPCPLTRGEGHGGRGRRAHGHVTSVRWDGPGKRLALGYSHGKLLIWDAGEMKVSQDMAVPKDVQLGCLCWWNQSLFCGTSSGRVYHFDLRDNSPSPVMCAPVHRRDVCSLQLSSDESTLACGGDDGVVSVWEPQGRALTAKIYAHKSGTKALAWCPWRRNVLATGGGVADGCIRMWNVGACGLKSEVSVSMQVCNILWSEEYRELVSGHHSANGNAIALWSVRDWTLSLLTKLKPPLERPLHQCLSPDGTTLASASADERLTLWKLFPRKRNTLFSTSPLNLDRTIR